MKKLVGLGLLLLALCTLSFGQVDTTFIYNTNVPYGTLDIRIAKSATSYYYLQEGSTFSFRESSPGVKTNTFKDMSAWDSSPYTEGHLREKSGSTDNFKMNYRLLKPNGYDANFSEGYPLIVLLHGSGERGNCASNRCYHADRSYTPQENSPAAPTSSDHELLNNDHNLLHGGRNHLEARNLAGTKLPDDPSLSDKAFPGFVLFPQNLNGWDQNSVQDAIRLIRLLVKKYNINEDRIYIEGISNGGHGLYEALKRAPWLFAAAIPMSAVDDGFIVNQGLSSSISHIPLWIFQGGLDQNPYPKETEKTIRNFRDAGVNVRYTLYSNLGHGTWNLAFKEPDFFSWMLGKNKRGIRIFSESASICENSDEGLKLELAEGFKAYQWEKDGQVISGATAYVYMAKDPGSYRARFSRISSSPAESQWNEWSEPVEVKKEASQKAEIRQIGTVLLKDLNDFTDARLESATEAAHYYWYKDGELIDLPGNQDDTLKYITISPGNCSGTCSNNGVYTLATASYDHCSSTVSEPKYVFFNDQAPINMKEPLSLRGAAASTTSTVLIWIDASSNENGFEIWRRQKIGEGSFSSWEMATITTANTSSFKDTGLQPATVYQYKIRAVSNTGRSEYAPRDANRFLEVKTAPDNQGPAAPQNLQVRATAVQTLRLSWQPSEDNSGIQEYHVMYGDNIIITTDTTLLLTGLELNTIYPITVTAVDIAGNVGVPTETKNGSTYVYGLFYEHSTGTWPELDSINWSNPEFTGTVYNFTLKPKTQEDYFNFRFDGFLFINTAGSYQFRTISNDGSKLRLDGQLLVDNDGIHNTMITATSTSKSITAGEHRITVEFFDFTLSDSLVVQYKGPDSNNQWASIPDEAIRSSLITGIDGDVNADNPLSFSLYPNPASQHEIHVKVQSIFNDPVQLRLTDPLGRTILSNNFEVNQVREGITLSPDERMSDGIYVIMIHQGTHIVKQKLFIKN